MNRFHINHACRVGANLTQEKPLAKTDGRAQSAPKIEPLHSRPTMRAARRRMAEPTAESCVTRAQDVS